MIRLLLEQPQQGESSQILVRTKLRAVVQRMGFSPVQQERAELVCTEVLTNQQKYGRGGLLQLWESQWPVPALELFALDYGPGIPELGQAFEDGYTTSGTLGRGLGAIRRLADEAEVYSAVDDGRGRRPWHGVAAWARFNTREAPAQAYHYGGFLRAYNDDVHNGDLLCVRPRSGSLAWLHMDGLGHGREAEESVAGLEEALERDEAPDAVIDRVSSALAGRRGGVGVAGEMDGEAARLCGVGDITAAAVNADKHALPFAPGVLGHAHRRCETHRVELAGATRVLTASDGIRRSWEAASFPGLWGLHPQMIALVMGNVLGRGNDDKSLFVAGTNNKEKA